MKYFSKCTKKDFPCGFMTPDGKCSDDEGVCLGDFNVFTKRQFVCHGDFIMFHLQDGRRVYVAPNNICGITEAPETGCYIGTGEGKDKWYEVRESVEDVIKAINDYINRYVDDYEI